jgi:hypothetical protein
MRYQVTPSVVTSVRIINSRACASASWVPRSLPTRMCNVGTPFIGEMTATFVNTTIAGERANFANIRPVDSAVTNKPTIASDTTTRWAVAVDGAMAP